CWGNWEGPHVYDIALSKVLPVFYQANAGALSIEFANPRHQHEYAAFKAHPFPADKILIPGVIESTSNFVEHPEVVARRIEEAVAAIGDRELVIASTDCGFGTFAGREWVAASIVWPKLKTLRNVLSFGHTIEAATHSRPAKVPKPQSVEAMTSSRSPIAATASSMRRATTSGCSTKFEVDSITPGI